MGHLLLLLVVALVAAALVFGVVSLITGGDPGLEPAEPDGAAAPLPVARPLGEDDLAAVRFDTALRGYRMAQVDQALRRAAYDIGYKEELINVLHAEVQALREHRLADADALRAARENAARPVAGPVVPELDITDLDVALPEPDGERLVDPEEAAADLAPADPAPAGTEAAGTEVTEVEAAAGTEADEVDDAADGDAPVPADGSVGVSVASGAAGDTPDAKR
jgi:DivIVA domain-containing protein